MNLFNAPRHFSGCFAALSRTSRSEFRCSNCSLRRVESTQYPVPVPSTQSAIHRARPKRTGDHVLGTVHLVRSSSNEKRGTKRGAPPCSRCLPLNRRSFSSRRVVTSRSLRDLSTRKCVLVAVRVTITAVNLPAAHVVVTVASAMRVLLQGGVLLLVHRTPPARV